MSDIFDTDDLKAVNPTGAQAPARGGVFDSGIMNDVASSAAPKSLADQIPGGGVSGSRNLGQPDNESLFDKAKGAVQAGASFIDNAVKTPIAAAAGVVKSLTSGHYGTPEGVKIGEDYANSLLADTYKPSTATGQRYAENVGKVLEPLGAIAPLSEMQAIGTLSGPAARQATNIASDVKNVAGEAMQQTAAEDMAHTQPAQSVYEQARATYSAPAESANSYPSQYPSLSAAGSAIRAKLSVATPELQSDAQAVFNEAQQKYGNDWTNHIDWNAIDRQLNADSLPVPGRLTRGQATQDGALISDEWNKRSTNGLAPIFAAQNENQIANLKAIREQSAPDVYTNTPAEHADTLINAYKDLHAQEQGIIDQKWNAIRQQSGDAPIFNAGQMLQDAQAALKSKKLTAYDPGGQLAELTDDARRGGLTADGYIAWRQNLGREAMKGGNEGAAASAILDATNKSDLKPEAIQYRDMVNDALATGRALHQKLAADPAYQAVVNGNASTKDFVNKFIINGKPEKIAQMSNNLAGNDVARQTMRAAVLDNIRQSAALNEQYQGNFAAKGFNKQLSYITPGARSVFDDGELQTLRALGDYSSHISYGGRDTWKNFSNTATELQTPTNAMTKKIGSIAGTGAEAALAGVTGGMSVPIISTLKAGAAQRAAAKAALEQEEQAAQYLHESTRPAAGFIK